LGARSQEPEVRSQKLECKIVSQFENLIANNAKAVATNEGRAFAFSPHSDRKVALFYQLFGPSDGFIECGVLYLMPSGIETRVSELISVRGEYRLFISARARSLADNPYTPCGILLTGF
jgi:hypothetical protein